MRFSLVMLALALAPVPVAAAKATARRSRAAAPAAAAPAPAPAAPKPALGTAIRVVVRAGALSVEQVGHVVPCSRDLVCAVVGLGKHVEGRLEDGKLIVEVP